MTSAGSLQQPGTRTPKGAEDVSATAIATMVVILGFVWGGLALILTTAIRKEREKQREGPSGAG